MKAKAKASKIRRILWMVWALLVLPFAWFFIQHLEGKPPIIKVDSVVAFINLSHEISGTVSDQGRGVRRLRIALRKENREFILLDKTYPFSGFMKKSISMELPFSTKMDLKEQGGGDGPAVLYMEAWDYAWRNWGAGNHASMEKPLIIDTMAPRLEVLSRQHNIRQGGAGLVIYRVSEPDTITGVFVAEKFFPGHAGYFNNPLIYMAFFALEHIQGSGTNIQVSAVDQAGNSARSALTKRIKKKKFRQDKIELTEDFLQRKMTEFDSIPEVKASSTIEEKFLLVNRSVRKENEQQLTALGLKTDPRIHWEGAFLRLPQAAPMAEFGDRRTYEYQGQAIDQQYHLGVDLASLEQSAIPAANSGKVVFVGEIGIYGGTVAIDHGFGLLSIYAHLSRMDVTEGEQVEKGKPIGLTGNTGLAGGDHLHYAMMVHNTLVNPLEWWDESWIENNVISKINMIQSK